jgi:predicted metal-dependent HD superfamily phosphohydrolase
LPRLENELAKDLTYHSVLHTIDVVTEAERIALDEGITDAEELFLLKVACLYHDSGFLFIYKEHETAGCKLAQEELPKFNLTPSQIERICGMIMATKIPQTPHNQLEEIICDADLDYLGRNDFFSIGQTLFAEWKARKIVNTSEEWNRIQVNFFKQHHYFTATNKKLRGVKKLGHLKIIETKLEA